MLFLVVRNSPVCFLLSFVLLGDHICINILSLEWECSSGLFEVWCSNAPPNNATFYKLCVVLVSFPWLELVLFSNRFLKLCPMNISSISWVNNTGCLNENRSVFPFAYGIRTLTLEVFVRNNRVKTLRAQQSPWHLLATVKYSVPFFLSQRACH